jgi:hypothetical protein
LGTKIKTQSLKCHPYGSIDFVTGDRKKSQCLNKETSLASFIILADTPISIPLGGETLSAHALSPEKGKNKLAEQTQKNSLSSLGSSTVWWLTHPKCSGTRTEAQDKNKGTGVFTLISCVGTRKCFFLFFLLLPNLFCCNKINLC